MPKISCSMLVPKASIFYSNDSPVFVVDLVVSLELGGYRRW